MRPIKRPTSSGAPNGSGRILLVILVIAAIAFFSTRSGSSAKAQQSGGAPSQSSYGASLLADAESHDSESYIWGAGHQPSSWQAGDGVDCSGLVSVAVYEATHGKVVLNEEVVSDFPHDGHWTVISVDQAAPGDILLHLTGSNEHDHVAFVAKNHHNGSFDLFAAWTSNRVQSEQVGLQIGDDGSWYNEAARFKG